ncbi:uncharacterized protein LOC128155633 [Crassostrea angulata]|uniref:uncharacterized protein LOC128155633 n=1 Tax=Magallana angulata TaxID=2784310 RepID=UPI0022B0AD12|nr:uncharacterized protein LOC128155633 [Crassostrea angulata]
MEVILAIKFGINHTSNTCMIKCDEPKYCKEINVQFETQSNTHFPIKSLTTPTVALFDDKGAIQSYGFEAELQHIQCKNTSNHHLFREFVRDLFCSDKMVPDNLIAVNGSQMKSIDVVTAVLSHMISHIKTKTGFQSSSIAFKYVLTIPTCCCKESRAFMTKAAVKAGCSSENIKIVEEAAFFPSIKLHWLICERYFTPVVYTTSLRKQYFYTQYLALALYKEQLIPLFQYFFNSIFSEDNATLSVLYFINNKQIEIAYAENTEIWKGCHVLHDFVEMISSEARKTLGDFSEKYPLEYYNFEREVKTKIRLTSPSSSKLSIQLSPFILNETQNSENMQESVLRKECEDELYIKLDKCVIKSERSKILVSEAGKRIVDYIESELFTVFSDINHNILVGEFAQSPMLQEILKASFPAKNILIPEDANMAAVRGAVFFGHRDVSVKTDIVHSKSHSSLNNAQVVLPMEKRVRTIHRGDEKSPQPSRCVIL